MSLIDPGLGLRFPGKVGYFHHTVVTIAGITLQPEYFHFTNLLSMKTVLVYSIVH